MVKDHKTSGLEYSADSIGAFLSEYDNVISVMPGIELCTVWFNTADFKQAFSWEKVVRVCAKRLYQAQKSEMVPLFLKLNLFLTFCPRYLEQLGHCYKLIIESQYIKHDMIECDSKQYLS